VFLAALGATLISATVGATTLLVSGAIRNDAFPGAWSVWWAGDAMGILVVAPFLLTLTTIRSHPTLRGWKVVEAIALVGVLAGISSIIVVTDLPILFLLFPVLGWAAWRFQQPGAAPAALVVSLFATWAAVEKRGLFAGQTLSEEMFTLQAFNATVAFMSFSSPRSWASASGRGAPSRKPLPISRSASRPARRSSPTRTSAWRSRRSSRISVRGIGMWRRGT
jgi:integral membrane sensor domain MASE1